MRPLSSLLLAALGTAAVAWLLGLLFEVAPTWLILLVPMLLAMLFVAVIGVVSLWLRLYASRSGASLMDGLTAREALALYAKCWAVVSMGLTLCVTARWTLGLVSDTVRALVPWLDVVFYSFCILLTLAAMLSIIRGRTLHEARLRQAEAENQLLKSQLNPHFLYNTLNNIDALVFLDPERASAAVTALSATMRYLTYSSCRERVPVRDELTHLQQLADLQRLRMTRPDALVLQATIDDPKAPVAPLLLMPLVENCFKHCGRLDEERAIVLTLTVSRGHLTFTTDNNLPAETGSSPASAPPRAVLTSADTPAVPSPSRRTEGGVGLRTLRRRLALLYPSGRLTAERRDGRFRAELQIDLE